MIVDIVLNERTVDLRYNECLCKGGSYNEVLSMTNDFFFTPVVVKYMEKYLDITKTRYSGQIWPVPWHFVISRFHCSMSSGSLQELETVQVNISPCNVRVKSIRQKFSSNR